MDNMDDMVLTLEELEAMRLRDIEGLTQQECAERMEISRQTFQNIIDSARKKVAVALINGLSITIKVDILNFLIVKLNAEAAIQLFCSIPHDRKVCLFVILQRCTAIICTNAIDGVKSDSINPTFLSKIKIKCVGVIL